MTVVWDPVVIYVMNIYFKWFLFIQKPVRYQELQWHIETSLLILSLIGQQWCHCFVTVLLIIYL